MEDSSDVMGAPCLAPSGYLNARLVNQIPWGYGFILRIRMGTRQISECKRSLVLREDLGVEDEKVILLFSLSPS